MGHMIQGCIGNLAIINKICSLIEESQLKVEELPQQYYLLYITDSLSDYIQTGSETVNEFEPFEYLSFSMKAFLESVSLAGDFVYLETDYFGGLGSQTAGVFRKGKLNTVSVSNGTNIDVSIPYPERLFDEPINKSLREIGVICKQSLDEFDTLNLSDYRHMPNNDI